MIAFKIGLFIVGLVALAALSACAFAQVFTLSVPRRGKASWYGEEYKGKAMANGKPFDPNALTCAAWDWPLGTVLDVRLIGSDRAVHVVVTDRGPKKSLGRLIDLSRSAFLQLEQLSVGVIEVEVRVLAQPPIDAVHANDAIRIIPDDLVTP